MYFVYIIQSRSTKKFYTGITNNIDRRIKEHNSHKRSTPTTLKLNDYKLAFCQIVNNRIDARMLEKYLKSGTGREIRKEIVQFI